MRKLCRWCVAFALFHPLHWAGMALVAWVLATPPLPAASIPANLTAPEPDPGLLWMEMDADLLADVAMGEDPEALAAVMWVVLNRACPVRPYGHPECEMFETTIQRGRAFGTMKGGRFRASWHRAPGRRWARFYPGHWAQAQEVAWDVLLGLQGDPTGGADHFHRAGSWVPPWAPTDVSWILVGSHHFYRVAA